MASAPVIVSPPISTYLLSASLCTNVPPEPQLSVPSLFVTTTAQSVRLVRRSAVPVIPPATSSFVPGVVSPMPTLSREASTKKRPASLSPSMRKSASSPSSLKTAFFA